MNCEFSENGCQENFLLENIKLHMKTCVYNPNNIFIDCDHKIGNRSEHNCIENPFDDDWEDYPNDALVDTGVTSLSPL